MNAITAVRSGIRAAAPSSNSYSGHANVTWPGVPTAASPWYLESTSRLYDRIVKALAMRIPELEPNEVACAAIAARDAFMVTNDLSEACDRAWIGVSDEGVVMVQWDDEHQGIFLAFNGNGIFSVAHRRTPTADYLSGYQALPVSQGLPGWVKSVVLQLVGDGISEAA